MSGRDYRHLQIPHMVLQVASDQDPEKAQVFFVDRDGNETEIHGLIAVAYDAAVGGQSNWPEIELRISGAIRVVDGGDDGE